MFKRKTKYFVSDIDNYIKEIRTKIPKTEAQQEEINKYKKINYLRDNEVAKDDKPEIWEDF